VDIYVALVCEILESCDIKICT